MNNTCHWRCSLESFIEQMNVHIHPIVDIVKRISNRTMNTIHTLKYNNHFLKNTQNNFEIQIKILS